MVQRNKSSLKIKMKNMIISLLQTLKLYGPARTFKDWLISINPNSICHMQEMKKFYSQFVHKDDLCFDVGANMGNRTEIFLTLGATVVAIEPQEMCAKRLRRNYKNNDKVIIIQKALGEKEGEAELMISDAHTISSCSKEWITNVKTNGMFSAYRWDKSVVVPVTTLDRLVKEYGIPAFCKIDVEGFELQVLKGLSSPVRVISFEFTPGFVESTINCINHLSSIGTVRFNYSLGESMHLVLSEWVKSNEMCDIISSLPDKTNFGDVYARFI